MMAVAFALLEAAFLRSDFSFDVVASHSSTTTPDFYKVTAIWSSQEGSLLLWICAAAGFSSLALRLSHNRLRDVTPYAQAVLLGFAAFFAVLLLVFANPFQPRSPVPAEGTGLNPLLRHPMMAIHPAMLYSGYTLAAVPVRLRHRGACRAAPGRRLDRRHPSVLVGRLAVPGHRDPARRALVLRRAGLGRLLGLGPGRERLAACRGSPAPRSCTRS